MMSNHHQRVTHWQWSNQFNLRNRLNMAKKKFTYEIVNIIEIRSGKPMVSSLKIAEMLERPHNEVLRSIRRVFVVEISLGEISQWEYLDSRGKKRPVYWLGERQALIVMPFIGGERAIDGQRKLVDAYLYYRDNYANPPRADLLKTKRSANLEMTDAILEMRSESGKETDERHYMSEAKLVNWIVTGRFEAIDESSLSNEDVTLLERVRKRNAAYLLAGVDYTQRKNLLITYATKQRTKLLESHYAKSSSEN